MVSQWWQEVITYWNKPRRLLVDPRKGDCIPSDPRWHVDPKTGAKGDDYPYFWFHYLFSFLIETSPDFSNAWKYAAKLPAADGHKLQNLFHGDREPPIEAIFSAIHSAPVQKLDWRFPYPIQRLDLCLSKNIATNAILNSCS